MRAKTFWDKAKANYWAGREQDVYNIYDNATNMGNVRSSYNRAATVAGAGRRELEKNLADAYSKYKKMLYKPPKPPREPDIGIDPSDTSSLKSALMMKRLYGADTIEGESTGIYGPKPGTPEWFAKKQYKLRSREMD